MNKTGKRWICFLALLMCLCLLLTSCAPAPQQPAGNSEAQVENLAKLCKVWGYVKYTHPVFLLGEKDWDEELLKLIPAVSEADSDEVNGILHEWVDSLGEVDYGTLNRVPLWAAAKEEEISVQADTSWISADYLGEELTQQLSQLGPVPNIDRSKAPVQFNQEGVPDFSNEPSRLDLDYSEESERLLGLFRVWNAIKYYSPYLDLMDESWDALLPEYISKTLEQTEKTGCYLTLLELMTHLGDGHVYLWEDETILFQEFGRYVLPVQLTMAEGEWVVWSVLDNDCPLQPGDIIKELDGQEIGQVVRKIRQYVSVPNEQKLVKLISPWLLRSHQADMTVGVVRDEEEQTLQVTGSENYYPSMKREKISHQLLEENIGVIFPAQVKDDEIYGIMEEFRGTDGLVIDLREYPTASDFSVLLSYIMRGEVAMYASKAAQAVPGAFVKERQWAGTFSQAHPFYQQKGIYEYGRTVVVLIDQLSQSAPELHALALGASDRVILLGNNTLGSVANISLLPLPGGNSFSFSSVGVTTPEGQPVQRTGLVPDIEVYPTIEGIKEGRDELMEAAVDYILNQKEN